MTLFLSACPNNGDDTNSQSDTTDATSPDATTDTASTDTGVTTPSPTATDPCAEIGSLEVHDYNDSCRPPVTLPPTTSGSGSTTSTVTGDDNIDWGRVLAGPPFGLWVWSPTDDAPNAENCPNPVAAMRQELLIGIDPDKDLASAFGTVQGVLKENDIDSELLPPPDGDPAPPQYLGRVRLKTEVPQTLIVELLPLLQGEGWSTGFNYVEFVQPNYGLRPADDPEKPANTAPPVSLGNGQGRVLVVDSPTDKDFPNDQQKGTSDPGNDKLDESSGHGEFIQSLIQGQAPNATVDLSGIIPSKGLKLGSGRWAPMMFNDADVQDALQKKFTTSNTYDVVNLSLGGAGCPDRGLDERVALARAMRAAAVAANTGVTFVAAAGNAGNAGLHYPAAWRSTQAFDQMSKAVTNSKNPYPADVVQELSELRDYYEKNMFAVGSVDTTGARSGFSNCGGWINVMAEGSKQVADYPTASGPTRVAWSGTSFAAANVSAQLAAGVTPRSATSAVQSTKGTDC